MSLRTASRARRSGVRFIEPCLPSPALRPPQGPDWIHEIKQDGYRLMARRDGAGIRLITRNGYDWTDRYPLVREAVYRLACTSCLIDGEAVVCQPSGLAIFERMRSRRNDHCVMLYAFDLIELDGEDLRRLALELRKRHLARLLRRCRPGLQFADHLDHDDGGVVFHHACRLGAEGIVSKRRGSRYRSGRSPDWIKSKNPRSPAVKRESEEDWN